MTMTHTTDNPNLKFDILLNNYEKTLRYAQGQLHDG